MRLLATRKDLRHVFSVFRSPKLWIIMKITALLLVVTFTAVAAPGYSQNITLEMKNARLEAVFSQIEKISGYSFIYEKKLLKKTKNIEVSLHNATLQDAMDRILKDQEIEYNITDKFIVISPKKSDPAPGSLRHCCQPPGLLCCRRPGLYRRKHHVLPLCLRGREPLLRNSLTSDLYCAPGL